MLSKRVNGHRSTCMVMNSYLLVPIHTQSHQLPLQERWSIRVIHKLLDATTDHVGRQYETAYQLTPWLMEPIGSMLHSQGLSNNSYPEPNQPNYPH